MSQVNLFVGIHLVGMVVALGWGPKDRPYLTAALAFPIGLATTVMALLTLFVLRVPYNAWTVMAAALLPLAASIPSVRRRKPGREIAGIAVLWTAAFTVVCLAASKENISFMTRDSHQIIAFARVLGHGDGLSAIFDHLRAYGAFQIVAQSLHWLTNDDYLYALPAVFGASFIGVFMTTLGYATRGTTRLRAFIIVGLVTLALFSINLMLRHLVYVHTNLASAAYLFIFVTLFWAAEVKRDASALPLAFVALGAFTLQRVESPIIASIFLIFTVFMSRLPRRELTRPLVAYASIVIAWYVVLAMHVENRSGFLSPARALMVAGGMLSLLFLWSMTQHRWVVRITKNLPRIAGAVCGALLSVAFAFKPVHMLASTEALARNLTELPHWGLSWYVIVVVVALGFLFPSPRFRSPFAYGVPTAFAVIVLLAVGRGAYRFDVNDSANRMMVHFVPLIYFYIALKLMAGSVHDQRSQGAANGK